jgi:hypothetical protein
METQNDLDRETENSNFLILLFNQIPTIDEAAMAAKISEIEPIEGQVSIKNAAEKNWPENQVGRAFVKFDGHELEVFSVPTPYPAKEVEKSVTFASLSESERNILREHKVHVFCLYKGTDPDPVEQMIAMYKVVSYFTSMGLIGVLDPIAWNSMVGDFVNTVVEPRMIGECRRIVPIRVWTNVVTISMRDDSIWFWTKGHHRFGVQDFALLSTTKTVGELRKTEDLFTNLFYYSINGNIMFKNSETFEDKHVIALLSVPNESQEYLEDPEDPGNTIVVEVIHNLTT